MNLTIYRTMCETLYIVYPTLLRRTLLRPLALNRRFCWADSKVPRMALINRYRITRFNGFEIILIERFESFYER